MSRAIAPPLVSTVIMPGSFGTGHQLRTINLHSGWSCYESDGMHMKGALPITKCSEEQGCC